MAGYIRQKDRNLFPLKTLNDVLELFKNHLKPNVEPDLAILSIVVGAIENSLTCNQGKVTFDISEPIDSSSLPILELNVIEALYLKFHSLIKSSVDINLYKNKIFSTRELIKRVSDVIWNTLTRSYYKDRPHLQSLYSYLTGNKLDCFGVAFAVVAGCQVLGFSDVHLALSEDHAWVVFGEHGRETAEVTWHGKGNEDKRGQCIGAGLSAKSWLYVNNHPVICTRHMEVAALVSAINPSLNANSDAFEVALLQQELFWLLYDYGYLNKYPMALGNLGDLEEIAPSDRRPKCADLFKQAIDSARQYYHNFHVYPYTYQGGYFYRNKMYKEALESWSNAADVIRQYNYSRDDEEIYKEFLEIANDLIPFVMKVVSSGHNAHSIIKDPECFAYLLRFYDGICQWEEGSATPVLHIGWAKPLVNTISKFDASVRAKVNIICADIINEDQSALQHFEVFTNRDDVFNNNCDKEKFKNDICEQLLELESTNCEKTNSVDSAGTDTLNIHPSIEALTAACSEKILNPEFFLQGGVEPFVGNSDTIIENECSNKPSTSNLITSLDETSIINDNTSMTKSTIIKEENEEECNSQFKRKHEEIDRIEQSTKLQENIVKQEDNDKKPSGILDDDDNIYKIVDARIKCRPTVTLYSQKMKGLKDLLLSEKLNTQAISLQLTAQSQVQIGSKKTSKFTKGNGVTAGQDILMDSPPISRPKRLRRD